MSNLETVLDQLIERDEVALANVLHAELETNAGLAGEMAKGAIKGMAQMTALLAAVYIAVKAVTKALSVLYAAKKKLKERGKDTASVDRKIAAKRKKQHGLKAKAAKISAKIKALRAKNQ